MSEPAPMRRTRFVFICQGGELEAKSLLLAASMRDCFGDRHELTAAIPGPTDRWSQPSATTCAALESLGVELRPIANTVADNFPYGNKMPCLDLPTDCGTQAYVDSDILMLRDFGTNTLPEHAICAVPASFGIADDTQWARFYGEFGLQLPTRRLISLISQVPTPPYYNGGFIAVRGATSLAEHWSDTCRRLRAMPGIPSAIRDRFLDQVALPIAAARIGHDIRALTLEWNFPSWNLALVNGPTPIFFHYQSAERLLRERRTADRVKAVCERFPQAHAAITRIPAFAAMLDALFAH